MVLCGICVLCNLSRSHLQSLSNPGLQNFSRGNSAVGIPCFTDVAAAAQTLNCSSEDDLKEGDNQAEDQPDVNHLHVRGGGQLLYLAGEDGGHHQHNGQVDLSCITKELLVKEDGGKADEKQEDGGEVGGQQLCGNLSLQCEGHVHHVAIFIVFQNKVLDCEHGQFFVPWVELLKFPWQAIHVHHQNL